MHHSIKNISLIEEELKSINQKTPSIIAVSKTFPISDILPLIKNGKSVLICAHGNSLRSLIMSLENISPEEIVKLEIGTGDPILYSFSEENFLKENL